jgi:valyl-tRNA synthetase
MSSSQDVRYSAEKIQQGEQLTNKLWNASRLILTRVDPEARAAARVGGTRFIEDRWILSRLATTTAAVNDHLEHFHFSDAIRTLYDFTWSEFCDWYLEMAKSRLRTDTNPDRKGGVEASATENPSLTVGVSTRVLAQRMLAGVLDAILKLLHPIMPFVTESIWQVLNESAFERGLPNPEPAAESVMIALWSEFPAEWRDAAIEQRIGRMQELVRAVRNIRNEFNVGEKDAVDVSVRCGPAVAGDFQQLAPFILPLAKVGKLDCGSDLAKPPQSAAYVHPDFEVYVHLKGLIDVPAELKRLDKQKADKEKQLQGVRGKLSNASFVERAPAEVVEQQKQFETDLAQQIKAIDENLQQLRQT